MNQAALDRIVNAVLYEGYILYPYRPSVKNRQRWTFGGLVPRSYSEAQHGSDAWQMQTECLVQGGPRTALEVKVRFLHVMNRTVGEKMPDAEQSFRPVETLTVGDRLYQSWQEAVEREVDLKEWELETLLRGRPERDFGFAAQSQQELLTGPDGALIGVVERRQEAIDGIVELSASPLSDGLFKLCVRISNTTLSPDAEHASRDQALMRSLVSTHTLLGVRGGAFVSLIDPPEPYREFTASCHNIGTWPVLVGEAGATDTLLSAPIILYDYPQVAAESPTDLFDATEIDEILTLRILTLTDEEKRSMAAVDERARALLQRTESLPEEQFRRLHGTLRSVEEARS
jgi:hydrogenase maturation protease